MTTELRATTRLPWGLLVLIAGQIICAAIFAGDVITDLFLIPSPQGNAWADWHLWVEALASLSLWAAIIFEMSYIGKLLRRKEELEQSASIASAAVHDIIEAFLDEWRLTAAERDVAGLSIKGLTIAEVAAIRGSAEGTVKAHLNAIYRKSGTRNRSDMLCLIIEHLLDHGPASQGEAAPGLTPPPDAAPNPAAATPT